MLYSSLYKYIHVFKFAVLTSVNSGAHSSSAVFLIPEIHFLYSVKFLEMGFLDCSRKVVFHKY